MTEPESFGPEGGHMGVTIGGWRDDARRTEVDLEDTAALARRYERALREIRYADQSTADRLRAIAKDALEPD